MKAHVFTLSLVLAAASASAAQSASAPANFDALSAAGGVRSDAFAPIRKRTEALRSPLGYTSHVDALRGGSGFLWAPASIPVPSVGARKAEAMPAALGRAYLSAQSSLLGLDRQAIEQAKVTDAQQTRSGSMVARFSQRVDGIEVFNRSLNVLTDREGKLVAISGGFERSRQIDGSFARTKADAISAAIGNLGGHVAAALFSSFKSSGDYEWFVSSSNRSDYRLGRAVRVKPVYYPGADGLMPAYYVELFGAPANADGRRDAYAYVISASSGELLFRKNLVAHEGGDTAFSYRVFADNSGTHQPMDSPLGNGYLPFPGSTPDDELPRTSAAANLVSIVSGPISTGDAWLPDGATTTTGNHVDAFLDSSVQLSLPINLPVGGELTGDGYLPGTGDVRAALSGPNSFDYPIHGDDDPSTADAQQAAVVNLFYMNNWLHDWWYDHGFNEAAGNAQTLNYGRGGEEGDAVSAQGQDGSGRNNANMATPADGSSPTMQMYLFDGALRGETCQLSPNANCADTGGSGYRFAGASFGPQTFDVTGELVLANDGSAPTSNGCNDAVPADPTGLLPEVPALPDPRLIGKIALIDRGSCSFTTKEKFAMLSGAKAMVVVNNGDGNPGSMGNADIPINIGITTDALYTAPAVMIRKDVGEMLKAQLAAGQTVSLHVKREASIDYDGTFDNLVIAHEYFHYVSNRLVGNGSGLSNNQGGGMGEGWGDIDSMMLAVREEDRLVAGNERYQGAYGTGYYVVPSYYYGIRRMPYSYDFAKNSLTFKHIQDGVALTDVEASQGQVAAPAAFGTDGASNSEVHNTGEVWANMLFNVYVGLLNVPGRSFGDAQARMKDYIICGLKMTPSSPTFVDARDGILACAAANDPVDFNVAARAFARRGIGLDAVAPASNSSDNIGVTESYVALAASAPTLRAGIGSGDGIDGCDHDGVLDSGEAGKLNFALLNNGGYTAGQTLSGTISSTVSGLSFPEGNRVSFVAGEVAQTAQASVKAALASGIDGIVSLPIKLTLDAPSDADAAVRYPTSISATLIGNADIERSAAKDGFDHPELSTPDWSTASTGTTQAWSIVDENATTGSGNAWFAPDLGSATTLSLVTPSFSVPAGGSFALAFDHYYDFEADLFAKYDGGVIEVSVDGGAWRDAADFGATFTGGYNATLRANGRRGYGGESGGVLHEKLDFGTALAGHSARLRFVVATDSVSAGFGWIVDNVEVTGAGTPFFAVSVEDGKCDGPGGGDPEEPTEPNHTPVAKLTATPSSGTAPLVVSFDASASSDVDGDALSYTFNFGDGAVVTQSSPIAQHTYEGVGSYSASVTVMDPDKAASSASVTIQTSSTPPPSNSAPSASLTVSTTNGPIPLAVSFDASGSHDVDGDAIVEYRFDFGDGSAVATQSQPKTSHTYNAAGTFVASVIVKDARGATSPAAKVTIKATTTVVVTPPGSGPVAALTVSPQSGRAPLLVTFDGSQSFDSDGGKIELYIFDFGDGSPVVSQSTAVATHTYTAAGSYTPSLQVKNSGGTTSAKTYAGTVTSTSPDSPGDGGASGGRKGGGGALDGLLLSMLGLAGLAGAIRRRAR